MNISVRLSEEDAKLIKAYAEMNNISLSELIRSAVLEKIEYEYDLKCCEEAVADYKSNPTTFTHEEVAKILDLE